MAINDNQKKMLEIEKLELIRDLLLEYVAGANIRLSIYSSERFRYISAYKLIENIISEMKED